MAEPTLNSLAQRLDRVERENRRMNRACAAILGGIAALVLMGQASQRGRTVEAEQFILKDANGVTRTELHTLPDGSPTLRMLDKDGSIRIAIGIASDGSAAFGLRSREGKGLTALAMKPDGSAGLGFSDSHGRIRAGLEALATGESSVFLSDLGGKGGAQIKVLPDGWGVLGFRDKEGKPRAVLSLAEDGTVALIFSDKNEKPRVGLSFGPGDSPSLSLHDKDGRPLAALAVVRGLASLELSDGERKSHATLQMLMDDWPVLSLSSAAGKLGLSLGAGPLVGTGLTLEEKGRTRGTFVLTSDGSPYLSLLDEVGKIRANLGLDVDGRPNLSLSDEERKPRAILGHAFLEEPHTGIIEQRPTSSLVLLDRDGTVLWKAP